MIRLDKISEMDIAFFKLILEYEQELEQVENKEEEKINHLLNKLEDDMKPIVELFGGITSEYIEFKKHVSTSVDFLETLITQLESIERENERGIHKFVKDNTYTSVSMFLSENISKLKQLKDELTN